MRDAGLTATTQPPRGSDVVVSDVPIAPSRLWTEIVDAGGLGDCLSRALDVALSGLSAAQAQAKLEEAGVSAMPVSGDYDGSERESFSEYRDWVVRIHKHRDKQDIVNWLDLHREMGRGHGTTQTPYVSTQLQDVVDGPLALFAMADVVPSIVIPLRSEWFEHARNHRLRWLDFVTDLATTADVVLDCTTLTKRRLLLEHADDLPDDLVNEATCLHTSSSPPAVRDAAEQAQEDITNRRAWDLLSTLGEASAERRAYSDIHSDGRFDDVSRSARSHWMKLLRDADLVETMELDGEKSLVLLPAGKEALRQLEDDAPTAAGARASNARADRCTSRGASAEADAGAKESTPGESGGVASQESAAVNDPPKVSAGAVYSPTHTGGGEDRPGGEGEAVAAGDAEAGGDPACRWLPLWRHHATAAAAPSGGGFSLVDERTPKREDARDRDVSVSLERREIVVSVEADPYCMAVTGGRLAAAVLDDRLLNKVLTDDRLGDRLDGLAGGHLEVLRLARNLGYLPNKADARDYRDRLARERQKLLQTMTGIRMDTTDGGQQFNSEKASEVIRRARGLHGTMSHIFDLLGFDIVREVTMPEYARNYDSNKEAFVYWMARETAVCSRYGHYTAFRTMFEDRDDKRDQMLGSPVVDVEDPTGEMVGSWVIRGNGVERLRGPLESMSSLLDPAEDGRNYAEFLVDYDIVAGDRRSAIATAATRLGRAKHLDSTRAAVSLLHSLTGSPYATAEALYGLGSEEAHEQRELALDEIRFALAHLDPEQLLPTLDPRSKGPRKMLHALLNAPGPLSKAELAEWANVSKQTVSNNRDQLEALGLLVVEETGAGKADWYRLALPFRSERDSGPQPRWLDEDHPLYFRGQVADNLEGPEDLHRGWSLHDAVDEVLLELGETLSPELRMALVDGDVDVSVIGERWPELDPWLETLVRLVDERGADGKRSKRAPPGPQSTSGQFGEDPRDRQASLPTASRGRT